MLCVFTSTSYINVHALYFLLKKKKLCRFNGDFGQEKEILKWILNYLDATRAGLLTHLLGDGGPINIVYQNYDWSMNS